METLAFEMRTEVRCKRCDRLQPLPGMQFHATCGGCGADIDVAARHIDCTDLGMTYLFGGYYDVVAEAVIGRSPLRDKLDSDGSPTVLALVPEVRCRCGAALPLPAADDATELRCAACHASAPVRWPDAGTRAWDPRIWCVIGEGIAPEEDPRFFLVYRVDDALFASFAAYLAGSARGDEHGMSDEEEAELAALLWTRRRAALIAHGSIDLATARELVARDLDHGDAAAIDALLADDQVAALATGTLARIWVTCWSASDRVARRLAVASHAQSNVTVTDPSPAIRAILAARVTGPALATLAGDADPKVRAAVATAVATPAALLGTLAKDTDPSVKAAARANPSYHPGLFSRLFGG